LEKLKQDQILFVRYGQIHNFRRSITNDYQIKEVFLGKTSVDIAKLMVTTTIKEVFNHLDKDEAELVKLRK
ncbi:hypothetical protein, partial [Enterobacter hormaechei]|uniref:hypothetical protein n=1 Tax=Enterobacter hormaechei TaxID=158836 RepID=UPI0023E38441